MSDSRHRQAVLTDARATLPALDAGRASRAIRPSDRAADDVSNLLRTLEQDNIRRLSITLLLDLLALEAHPERATELVGEAAMLAEDLLHSGDDAGARAAIGALGRLAAGPRSAASEAAGVALEWLLAT